MNQFPAPGSPEFPMALKDLRESKGLSRVQLANISNVKADNIRRYEQVDRVDHAVPSDLSWDRLKVALAIQVNFSLEFDQLTLALLGNVTASVANWQPVKHNACTQMLNVEPHNLVQL